MYTYRLLRRECQSTLARLGRFLTTNTGDIDWSGHLPDGDDVAWSPVARASANDRRKEVDMQSPISTLETPRYARKLIKKERHLPEIVIPSKPDAKHRKEETPEKSSRGDATARLQTRARRFPDSPVGSPRSTTTEKLLQRARQAAVLDAAEEKSGEASIPSHEIRQGDHRRRAGLPSDAPVMPSLKREAQQVESPLSTNTEHLVRRLRQPAIEDDVVEAFDAKSVDERFPRVSPAASIAEGSALGSQASAVTDSQASRASDVTRASGATGSQTSGQSDATSALSSVGSTFASSERTSEMTQSSLWDSSMTASSGPLSTAQSGGPSSMASDPESSVSVNCSANS